MPIALHNGATNPERDAKRAICSPLNQLSATAAIADTAPRRFAPTGMTNAARSYRDSLCLVNYAIATDPGPNSGTTRAAARAASPSFLGSLGLALRFISRAHKPCTRPVPARLLGALGNLPFSLTT